MRFRPSYSILFVLFLLGCSSDEEATSDSSISDELQAVVDSKVGEDLLRGVSVAIRIDGQLRWQITGGDVISHKEKFGVGSVTKTVVAATTMKLVDQGLLTLDQSIEDILGYEIDHVNGLIKVSELLSHFTGLDGYMYPELWERAESNLGQAISLVDLTEYIGPPINGRGLEHQYSNSNYLLLGLIIEKVTGQTVGAVMRNEFWKPLGLSDIYFGTNEEIPEPIATPWRDNDGDGVLENIKDDFGAAFHSIFYCAADVFSTASDLALWAEHLYGGNAISESSRRYMMDTYVNIPDPTFIGYGYGTRKNVYAGHTMWGHTGGMRGYGSHMFYDPVRRVSIASLNNQSRSSDGPRLRHELVEELLAVVYRTFEE